MEVVFLSQGVDIVPKHIISAEIDLGVVVFSDTKDATILALDKSKRDKLAVLVKTFLEETDLDDAVAYAQEFPEWHKSLAMVEVETDGA